MTDQKPQVRGDQTLSGVSDRFHGNRRSEAIRHIQTFLIGFGETAGQRRSDTFSPKTDQKTDQKPIRTDQKNQITAGQAIRHVLIALPIRKSPAPYI